MKNMKSNLLLAAALLAAPGLADQPTVGHVVIGGPVYPTRSMHEDAADVANVLLNTSDKVQKLLNDEALLGHVRIGRVWVQQRQPLGKDNRIYTFPLRECRPHLPGGCQDAGSLTIKQSKFLSQDGEVYTYDVDLDRR